ncbi:hypothetical protein [Ktedonobacter racemifer]|uniref:Uncharacterized protein n=1 Tax=Ktedonobacter racemifer DSM 44963 TaxID=485913 RepID=D6U761_KTERA|nr:hypothetical protein [Ktedonobacter racemifer]EFH79722.1 hypothetical protein Krac_0214 [Ktedonobacter racemifer DSM 44963]
MTPKHQEIIDTTLQAIQARERQYHRALSLPPEEPFRRQSIEELRGYCQLKNSVDELSPLRDQMSHDFLVTKARKRV